MSHLQVEEAKKFGIRVTREQISQHFGKAYKRQLTKAPFYGISKGMTPQSWWKEVNNYTESKNVCVTNNLLL